MADDVTLSINGKVFGGWKSVSITRSLAALTSTFSLGLTERWPGEPDRRTIQKGQACEVRIGPNGQRGDLLITGWIETRRRNLSAVQHSITVGGRDKTCDLIDCACAGKPGSWKNQKLERIAADLIKPFGLTLKVEAATGAAFASFAIEHGEEVFSALTRACKMRGVMLGTDAAGNVRLFTPSQRLIKGSLELGRNVADIDVDDTGQELHSVYIVKGQSQGRKWTTPEDAAGPKGSATDPNVTRYRPKMIISDEQASAQGLQNRARWEATTRWAKSQTVKISVRGWRNDEGQLWEPGTMIPVIAVYAEVATTLMISQVTYGIDDKGLMSEITLVRKEAFTIEPLEEAGANRKAKKAKAGLMDDLPPGTLIEKGFGQ